MKRMNMIVSDEAAVKFAQYQQQNDFPNIDTTADHIFRNLTLKNSTENKKAASTS